MLVVSVHLDFHYRLLADVKHPENHIFTTSSMWLATNSNLNFSTKPTNSMLKLQKSKFQFIGALVYFWIAIQSWVVPTVVFIVFIYSTNFWMHKEDIFRLCGTTGIHFILYWKQPEGMWKCLQIFLLKGNYFKMLGDCAFPADRVFRLYNICLEDHLSFTSIPALANVVVSVLHTQFMHVVHMR